MLIVLLTCVLMFLCLCSTKEHQDLVLSMRLAPGWKVFHMLCYPFGPKAYKVWLEHLDPLDHFERFCWSCFLKNLILFFVFKQLYYHVLIVPTSRNSKVMEKWSDYVYDYISMSNIRDYFVRFSLGNSSTLLIFIILYYAILKEHYLAFRGFIYFFKF